MNWIYAVGTLIIAHLTGLPTFTNGQNQGKPIRMICLLILFSVFFSCNNLFTITGKLTRKKLAKRSLEGLKKFLNKMIEHAHP